MDQQGFDLRQRGFSRGPRWGGRNANDAIAQWNGQLLSGRYAHVSDSMSFFENFTWMPDDLWATRAMEFAAAAPHHEEIAVDHRSGKNVLYTAKEFPDEFERRYQTAMRHVRDTFTAVWGTTDRRKP